MIDPWNYGDIKKIRFSRASRTDKWVHALLNYFACKLHVDKAKPMSFYKELLNSKCPNDMHVFSLLEVNKHFDAKACTTYREYDYYIPSFVLTNKIPLDFKRLGELLPPIGGMLPHCKREMIEVSPETIKQLYAHKIDEETKQRLNNLLKKYEGTHDFTNFTKETKLKESLKSPLRYMYEIKAIEFQERCGIEFIRVYLKG